MLEDSENCKIPDSAAFFVAKKLRELKRSMQQTTTGHNNNNDNDNELEELDPAAARELDYISLKNGGDSLTPYRQKRGEDGDDDEEDEDGGYTRNIHAPRLVSEDQEMEGLEAFEDNQDRAISFGTDSIKNFDKKRKKEFEESFNSM